MNILRYADKEEQNLRTLRNLRTKSPCHPKAPFCPSLGR